MVPFSVSPPSLYKDLLCVVFSLSRSPSFPVVSTQESSVMVSYVKQYFLVEFWPAGHVIFAASVKDPRNVKVLFLVDNYKEDLDYIHLGRRLRYIHRSLGGGRIGVSSEEQFQYFKTYFQTRTLINVKRRPFRKFLKATYKFLKQNGHLRALEFAMKIKDIFTGRFF
jgi:hypothetical protein